MSRGDTVRRFRSYVSHEHRLIVLLSGLMTAGAVVNLFSPWPVKIIVDNVLGHRPLGNLSLSRTSQTPFIVMAAFSYFGCIFLRGYFNHISHAQLAILAERLALRWGKDLFLHMQRLPVAFHDRTPLGEVSSRLNEDVAKLKEAWIEGFSLCGMEAVTFGGIALILFWIDWRFTLLAIGVLLPLFWIFGTFPQRIQKNARSARAAEGDKAAFVQESLSSLRLIKAFAGEGREKNRWVRQATGSLRHQSALVFLEGRFIFMVELFTGIGMSLVIGYGAWRVQSDTLTLGTMLVFLQYLTILYTPVGRLSRLVAVVQKAMASYCRVAELMEVTPEPAGAATAGARSRGSLRFDSVSFGYEGGRLVLDKVDLQIGSGERVAILGRTGEGKSSLLHLLLGFYHPLAGRVLLDGRDIRDMDPGSVRKQIALIAQEPHLRRSTVRENIAFGSPGASMAEIVAAAKSAHAHDFISRLPDQYDTQVAERGASLSGGERQRLAIARALLKNAPILLMDEPTSAIDDFSEDLVMDALQRLVRDKTVIFTTHRKSLLRLATRCLVLSDGELTPQPVSARDTFARERAASSVAAQPS